MEALPIRVSSNGGIPIAGSFCFGLQWKILLKWIISRYLYFRKPPYDLCSIPYVVPLYNVRPTSYVCWFINPMNIIVICVS